ncbi:MAG: hypothetical protein WCR67_01650 [Bacilli bacterium]
MQVNTLIDKARGFVNSAFYPLSLALMALLTWMFENPFIYLFVAVYCLLGLLPLLCKDGRGYIPFLLFSFIMPNTGISFTTYPPYLCFVMSVFLISVIAFIIIRKVAFRKGDLLIYACLLFLSFFISYIYNSAVTGVGDSNGILYILGFFILIIVYSLLSTILGTGESFNYLSKTIALFSFAILVEIFIFSVRNGFEIAPHDFTLGWSYTSQTASTLLCLSLPFYGVLVYQKKFIWGIGELFVIAGIILLSTDSGLLCLLLGIIPLILLSFRSYGKFYPYFSLVSIATIGIVFCILLALNTTFNQRVITAIQSLALFNEPAEWRNLLFSEAITDFKSNPYIGTSISSFSNINGTLTLSSNTILSTLVMGGSVGLGFYFLFEVIVYYRCLIKKTADKWFFLMFLLSIELIGLIDNTIYNLSILFFFLIVNACYQRSNREEDVIVHSSFYDNFRKE